MTALAEFSERYKQLRSIAWDFRKAGRTRDDTGYVLRAIAGEMPPLTVKGGDGEPADSWDALKVVESVLVDVYGEAPASTNGHGAATIKLTDLVNVEPERVSWHFDGFVPKGIPTTIIAPGGTVKGLWMMHIAAEHIDGPVLYLGSEDNLAMILKPRALAAGVDPARFVRLTATTEDGTERPLTFPRDAELLRQAIEETGARLVVIDSGIEHMDEGLKSSATEDVRRVMQSLNAVCEATHVTPLIVHHTNKTKEARGSDRGMGSRTWIDASRHVLMAAKDDEDENVRHVEVVKTNIAPRNAGRQYRIAEKMIPVRDRETGWMIDAPVPHLVDEGESSKSVDDLLANRERSNGSARNEIEQAILEYLAEDIATTGGSVESGLVDETVAKRVGCKPRTVRDRRMKLNTRGWTKAEPMTDDEGKRTGWLAIITADGLAELGRTVEDSES